MYSIFFTSITNFDFTIIGIYISLRSSCLNGFDRQVATSRVFFCEAHCVRVSKIREANVTLFLKRVVGSQVGFKIIKRYFLNFHDMSSSFSLYRTARSWH